MSYLRFRQRFLLLICAALIALTARRGFAGPIVKDRPRLVVIVVVDQMRADYLTRFEPYFGDDGFRRLMREGAYFANAHLNALNSATAPGHATIGTGATPRVHGIVANKWYMTPDAQRSRYAVMDEASKAVPAEEGANEGKSPHLLQAPTLGDQMKLADRRTRLVSIALKDRAAIYLGGRTADRALWWNFGNGQFMSSTFYGDALPEYAREFNAGDPTKKYADYIWRPLTPAHAMAGAYPIEASWHRVIRTVGETFPHKLPPRDPADLFAFTRVMWATPAGNEIVLDLVERAIGAEHLGEDDVTDLLCVGFSANDGVGHFFGPQSAEVMDMTVQTDRQIARLLGMLDEQVGRDRYVVALAADHGVKASPPVLAELHELGGLYDAHQLADELDTRLRGEFFSNGADAENKQKVVVGIAVPWVYLNMPLVDTLPAERRSALFASAIAFLKSKALITDAYGPDLLAGVAPPATDSDRLLAWNSWNPKNAGPICLRIAHDWKKRDSNLAGHNGGSVQERHVPILFYGPGVRKGRFYTPATPCDIAVTLAAIMGIEPPNAATGHVLGEAIETP